MTIADIMDTANNQMQTVLDAYLKGTPAPKKDIVIPTMVVSEKTKEVIKKTSKSGKNGHKQPFISDICYRFINAKRKEGVTFTYKEVFDVVKEIHPNAASNSVYAGVNKALVEKGWELSPEGEGQAKAFRIIDKK
jgi:hypothetical protein